MKTLTLKESQTLYEAIAVAAPDEPLIVERNGQPVYVLVPYAEYQALHPQRRVATSARRANRPENRTLEDVVADIKQLGPSCLVREPTASLAEQLAHSPHDPDFNLEEWTREWAKIESEMKAAEQRDWLKTEAEMRSILGPE
jgi:hypothetical protein